MIDWPWIGGFIDADGTIGAYQHGRSLDVLVSVTSVSRKVVEAVHQFTGVGRIACVPKRTEARRDVHTWTASARQALSVLEKVEPFLFLKQPQSRLARFLIKRMATTKGKEGRALTGKERELRVRILDRLRCMKRSYA